jgi:HlyD family secretion protein
MRKVIFLLSSVGLLAGLTVAYVSGITQPPLPPAFSPATNPYPNGIYAEGIVESSQPSGENLNVYPEVSGTVKQILVTEGQNVMKGTVLMLIDDSIQRATAGQLQSQAQAALSLLKELKAEPRKETLDVAEAQVVSAQASWKTTVDEREKQQTAFALNPKSISKDALDSAVNAATTARANLDVAARQRDLTKAGAWIYDIRNQQDLFVAATKAALSASALLAKYTLRAPVDGVALTVNPAVGSLVSTQGVYDSYTQGMDPVLVLGTAQTSLQVRAYVDEILVPRLPSPSVIKAQMSVRGSAVRIDLQFLRVQPTLSPKIELSDQKLEQVDVRVLPVIFRLDAPQNIKLYPGELVDVFIGQ